MLPPETIELIVLQTIFSDDPRIIRRTAFNSLSLLSRDWSLQARRLELLHIELESSYHLDRLVHHLMKLKAEEPRDSTQRAPVQWLAVDLGGPQDLEQLVQLLDLLDLSRLKALRIQNPYDMRGRGGGLHVLPRLDGLPSFPQLESLTAIHLSGQSISSLVLACDSTRLKTLRFSSIQQWIIEENVRLAGVTFPSLTSFNANFYGLFCGGGPAVDVPIAPNLEEIALTRTMRPWDWAGVAERFRRKHPPRLTNLEVQISNWSARTEREIRLTSIHLAKAMGWTVSVIKMDQLTPVERFDFTRDSELPL